MVTCVNDYVKPVPVCVMCLCIVTQRAYGHTSILLPQCAMSAVPQRT